MERKEASIVSNYSHAAHDDEFVVEKQPALTS